MKPVYLSVFICFFMALSLSCAKEHDDFDSPIVYPPSELSGDSISSDDSDSSDDSLDFGNLCGIELYSNNSCTNQSAAVFEDYLVLVPKFRGRFYLYNMKEKKLLCSLAMEAMKEVNSSGGDIYHCNQTSFGTDYFDEGDQFPLLYISQRSKSNRRCFTEVFRILPKKKVTDVDYSSLEVQLVQTIYFPPMTESNSLGTVNCVIDKENHLLYTYSRNNISTDANYRKCKISCFEIPDVHQSIVYLEDSDIKSSFLLDSSAVYMQGGCINGRYLFIGQGSTSVGFINLNIVDLKSKKLNCCVDLLDHGITWEPEGCFVYNDKIMISTGKNIWQLNFE